MTVGVSGTAFHLVDLADAWPALRNLPDGAAAVLERCMDDPATLAFQGDAGLFVVLMRPGHNPGTLEAYVLLALAARHGAFEDAEPAVLAIAGDLNATTVAFRSVRRGWARKLGPAWMPRGNHEFWRYVNERT